jgi:hypothetical protein
VRRPEFSELFSRRTLRGVRERETAGRDEANEKRSLEAPSGLGSRFYGAGRRDGRRQGLHREDSGKVQEWQGRNLWRGREYQRKTAGHREAHRAGGSSLTAKGGVAVANTLQKSTGIYKSGAHNSQIGHSIPCC